MNFKKSKLFILMLMCVVIYPFTTASAKLKKITEKDIERIRVISANNVPRKVMVVLQNTKFVQDLVKHVVAINKAEKLSGKDRIKIYIILNSLSLHLLKTNHKDSPKNLFSASELKYIEFNKGFTTSDIWMQDWGEIAMVKVKTNPRPQLLLFDSGRERGLGLFAQKLAKFWSGYYIRNPFINSRKFSGEYGGNIEVTPDDVLIVGNTISKELISFLKRNGYKNRIATVESDWLSVGHCDEYLSVVPNKQVKNGYSIVKADPMLALRLIQKTPISDLEKIKENAYRTEMLAVKKVLMKDAKLRQKIGSSLLPSCNSKILIEKYALLKNKPILANNISCSLMLHGHTQKAEARKRKESLAMARKFIKINVALATLIDFNIGTLVKKINKVNGTVGEKVSVISYPSFFRLVRDGSNPKYTAFIPGSVNQLVLRNHLLIPDPMIASFRRYIAKAVRKIGLSEHFIYDMYYHSREGEIHCGTNVFREPNRYFVTPKHLPNFWKQFQK